MKRRAMQYGYSPFSKVYVPGRDPEGMSVAVGPLVVGLLTARVAVGVNDGLVGGFTAGVGVLVAACGVSPIGVLVLVAAPGTGEPVRASAVPVPKISTSLMLGV